MTAAFVCASGMTFFFEISMSKVVIVTRDGMEWELIDSQIVSEDKDYVTIRKTYNPKVGLPVSIDIFVAQKQKEAHPAGQGIGEYGPAMPEVNRDGGIKSVIS
jgi:hypothetical protein